jgi:hypothetical protein
VPTIPYKNLKRIIRRLKDVSRSPTTYHGGFWGGALGALATGSAKYYSRPKIERKKLDRYARGGEAPKKLITSQRKWALMGAVPGLVLGAVAGGKLGLKIKLNVAQFDRAQKKIFRNFSKGTRNWHADWFSRVNLGETLNRAKTEIGVQAAKTKAEVVKRHRDLIKQFHPDISKDPESLEKIKKINNAWSVIKDSDWFTKLAKINLVDFTRIILKG